jgi:hypothetical protein
VSLACLDVAVHVSGQRGSAWLDAQTIKQAWRSTEMLGMVMAYGPDKNLSTATRDEWDAAGRTDFDYIARGEQGVLGGLEAIFLARPHAVTNAGPQKVFGCFHQWLAFELGSCCIM